MSSSPRFDIYARFLSAARAFPEPPSGASPSLSESLATLREAAIAVELIAPWLDREREGLLQAAEHLEDLVATGDPNREVVKEARAEYDQAVVELRDSLRVVTVELIDRAEPKA